MNSARPRRPRPWRAAAPLAALLATLLAAAPAHASKTCDQCEDLPRLYRELLEQEFLRNKFQSWVSQAYYPVSIDAMQQSARNALNAASGAEGFYGPSSGGGKGGSSEGANARPELGTDTSSGKCQLMDLSVKPAKPITPEAVSRRYCKPVADFLLAHEQSHIDSCKAAQGGKQNINTVEWFAKDDAAAYQAGIEVLRKYIAALAKQCSWSGSSNELKPDKTKVVPTPKEIANLATQTKAKAQALQRATK